MMVFPIKIPIRYHHFSYNNEKISNQFEILENECLGVYEGGWWRTGKGSGSGSLLGLGELGKIF